MDAETTRLVATVAASSATAITLASIGLVGTFMARARAHRRQLEADESRHRREVSTDADRAIRSREEAAAEECDRSFSVLVREELAKANEGRETPSAEMRQRREAIRTAEDAIGAYAAYLPEGLRTRLLFLRDAIGSADELYREGHHPSGRYANVNNAGGRAHAEVARFMRREPVQPTWMDPLLIEYEYAVELLFEDRQSEYAPEIAEEDDAHAEWLEHHPELRDCLDAALRRSSSPVAGVGIRGGI